MTIEAQKLPAGWRWAELGKHVSKIGSGITPSGGHASYLQSGIPLIRSQNVHLNRFCVDGLAFISEAQDAAMSNSRVLTGDVLLNITGASIGRVCVAPLELCPANVNQHVSIIRCRDGLDSWFLSFYISSPDFQRFIMESQSGATRQALTKAQIEKFSIPLPPLPEQKRIVTILVRKMAAIEKALAAAEQRLKKAKELPAAYLREMFESEEAKGWPKKKLGDILRLRNEIIHPLDKPTGKAIFVGLEHLVSGTGSRKGEVHVDMETLTGRKPKFYSGDIVYGYLRPYLNKVWIAEFDGLCSVDQYVYAVDQGLADTRYVAWYMRSPLYLKRAPIDTTPGQLPRIRKEEVASVEIELPPLPIQVSIADKIDARISMSRHIFDMVHNERSAIEKMPAALLRQAFNGEV